MSEEYEKYITCFDKWKKILIACDQLVGKPRSRRDRGIAASFIYLSSLFSGNALPDQIKRWKALMRMVELDPKVKKEYSAEERETMASLILLITEIESKKK